VGYRTFKRDYGEIPRATAELAKHCTEITLIPEGDGYKLSGEWDLLGDVRSDGAGGAAQTDRDIRFTIKVAA
jgi:hypothetical protein